MSIQGSPEWFAERLGKVTASRIADIMAKTKTGPSASRANYLAQLVAERLTGIIQESYTNDAMKWGTETEPLARAHYEIKNGVMVDQVGFISHPWIEFTGCSPDGIFGDGLIEIKCPNTATHIDTLINKKAPSKYIYQMQWQMECAGSLWCDFVSFDPRMPENLALFVTRVERDESIISNIKTEVLLFLDEVNSTVKKLKEMI